MTMNIPNIPSTYCERRLTSPVEPIPRSRRITALVAVNRSYAIGLGEKLPWSCPSDLRRFKKLTTGQVLVLGAKTYLGLRKLNWRDGIILPERDVIVVYGVEGEGGQLKRQVADANELFYFPRHKKRPGGRFLALPVHRKELSCPAEKFAPVHEALLRDIASFAEPSQHVYVGGGAAVYELMLPIVDYLDVTQIDAEVESTLDTVYLRPQMIEQVRTAFSHQKTEAFTDETGITGSRYFLIL